MVKAQIMFVAWWREDTLFRRLWSEWSCESGSCMSCSVDFVL